MELYLANLSLPYYHDCSIRNRSFEDWQATGDADVITSIPLLIYGLTITTIYLLVILVFTTQHDIWVNPFYRIMLWISFCDLSTVVTNADVQAVLQMLGAVFCSYPNFTYYIGCLGEAGWAGSCIGCFILIVSRFVDLLNKQCYQMFFGGPRILVSFVICFLYWCVFFFIVNPVLFNSQMRTWLYDPLVYEDGRWAEHYNYRVVVFNNMALTSSNLLVYIIFAFYFIKKFKVGQSSKGKSKLVFFIQSSVICANHVVVGFMWVIMNWIPPNETLSTIASLSWQLSGGSSAISYVAFNKTIRTRMLAILGIKKRKTSTTLVSITGTASHKSSVEDNNVESVYECGQKYRYFNEAVLVESIDAVISNVNYKWKVRYILIEGNVQLTVNSENRYSFDDSVFLDVTVEAEDQKVTKNNNLQEAKTKDIKVACSVGTLNIKYTSQFVGTIAVFTFELRPHDVVLLVGEKKLYVHKLYLATWSKYFDTLFYGEFVEKDKKEIKLEEIEFDEFEVLLCIIHPEMSKKVNDTNVLYLLKLADRFDMPSVMAMCGNHLMNFGNIPALTLMERLELSDKYNLSQLQVACLKKIHEKTAVDFKAFLDTNREKIKNLSYNTLKNFI